MEGDSITIDTGGTPEQDKEKGHHKFGIQVEKARSHMFSVLHGLSDHVSIETLRPLTTFLGTKGHPFRVSKGAFTSPLRGLEEHDKKQSLDMIQTRLSLNGAFFLTNYVFAACGIAVVISLLHPGMLFVCSVVWGLWWFHDYLIHHEVKLGPQNLGTMLSITHRSTILTVITIVATLWKCLVPVMSCIIVSTIVILFHACLRDPQQIESYHYGSASSPPCTDEEETLVERGDAT
mmetsp:Transcript_14593/g.21513  ORF Transcript_14593/g.21513 Transcript_14593/m.21513 type:complete len:234 (+) Transcript_14593:75-776(+)